MSDNSHISQRLADIAHANKLLEDADKVRKAGLYNQTLGGQDIRSASPSELDKGKYKHSFDAKNPATAKNKNFDEKLYLFPESYNALRRELVEYWPHLWELVGYRMAHLPEEFCEHMNSALDTAVVFDTEAVDFICSTYLSLLRKKRGVSA